MEEKKSDGSIFREKSIDRINSPEQLDSYIRVTTPSVWIILIALIVLLLGFLAWSIFGKVEVRDADGKTEEVAPISYVTN